MEYFDTDWRSLIETPTLRTHAANNILRARTIRHSQFNLKKEFVYNDSTIIDVEYVDVTPQEVPLIEMQKNE